MRRIVVFDSGWGGELVADYLTQELEVVEVVRVIDWARKAYNRGALDIDAAIECLQPYIGAVDLIVLGGYTMGIMLRALKSAFPKQAFVAPTVNFDKMLRSRQYPERVAIFMNDVLRGSALFRELRERLAYSTLILPNCTNWEYLIDNNLMTTETVRAELAWDFEVQPKTRLEVPVEERKTFSAMEFLAEQSLEKRALMRAIQNFGVAAQQASQEEAQRAEVGLDNDERTKTTPDLVLILNTHFWELKTEIERLLGWKVRVLDFREKLLHDVCAALKLRGVDGRRAK